MTAPVRRIGALVSFRHHKGREIMRGLLGDPDRTQNWHLRCEEPTPAALRTLLAWGAEGLVAQANEPALVEALLATGRPAVNVGNVRPDPRLPLVAVDDRAVGRAAAEHLLARFAGRLAVLGEDSAYAAGRLAGFAAAAAEVGVPVLRAPACGRDAWLAALPRPCGLFIPGVQAAYDGLHRCRDLGIRVPEDLAVIGADDDPLLCMGSWPSLSCVDLAGAAIGAAAAGLLERLLAGAKPPRRPLLVPPGPVIARRSTDAVACDDPLLHALITRMRARLAEPVGVRQLLAGLAGSRRSIEARCRARLGRTPHRLLTGLRLERARQLLTSGALPLAEVARRSGIATAEHLIALFRRHCGCTPGEWRERQR